MARKTVKIGVVGLRDFNDPQHVFDKLDKVLSGSEYEGKHIVIYSGGATGIDDIVEDYVLYHNTRPNVSFERLDADWDNLGKAAGFIRNGKIVESVSRVFAFWDKVSRGTKDTIDKALKARKPVRIFAVKRMDSRYVCKRKLNNAA